MTNQDNLYGLAQRLGGLLRQRGLKLATAESCTGGWVGQAITSVPGSSEWYDRGIIAYSNQAKQDMLGVSETTLGRFGAVSEQTVTEMVSGALQRSGADLALAISGVAGPGGGTGEKPVGIVCFAWGRKGAEAVVETRYLQGDRAAVRRQAVEIALQRMLDLVGVPSDAAQ